MAQSETEVDVSRPDYVFLGGTGLFACAVYACSESPDVDTAGCEGGAGIGNSVADPGTPKYMATYTVHVSEDAAGLFTLDFDVSPGVSVALNETGQPIPITTIPALISVIPPAVPAVSARGSWLLVLSILSVGTIVCRRSVQPASST